VKPAKAKRREAKQPELFLNRELSWLAFNNRVLEEAADPTVPLLERLKFATIVSSNLDEFFMVRVAALKNAIDENDIGPDPAGLSPAQQLAQIRERAHDMIGRLYETALKPILAALVERGIRIDKPVELPAASRQTLSRLFRNEILPTLTPLAIDASRPFPMLAGLSLNIALLLEPAEGETDLRMAVVQVPVRSSRLVRALGADGTAYVLLEEVIREELGALFPGQKVRETAVFRVSRDAEMDLDDEGGRDFMAAIEEELKNRRRNRVVRLEVEVAAGKDVVERLTNLVGVDPADVYRIAGLLDPRALWPLVDLADFEEIFRVLDERTVVLHHPYESFDPVVALVARAAEDPDVLAIKQTLYRTGGDSSIVKALARAADRGKQVTVLVELLARFDEQSNILWARSLEEAGAHVIYGIRGFKTHSKICLVIRRGRNGIRRYVHLGTGNYNERTARVYTDLGMLTSDDAIGADASAFFNALTGYSDPPEMDKLVMAPTRLRDKILRLIARETERARAGQPAEIRAKVNALVDEDIIRALYEASTAGVGIKLNVRGICCLRPGVKGVSENIEVVSIVDRFLEHSRIYHFRNGGDEEVYLASADWMPRNLDRRIELLFPIEAPEGRAKVLAALDTLLRDNVKARVLQPDGSYKRRKAAKGEEAIRAQARIPADLQRAWERAKGSTPVTFEPVTAPRER
jgi:polyphosphate kinase